MKARIPVIIIVIASAIGAATAQTMWARGSGTDSCGNWTMQRQGTQTIERGTLMVAQGMWVLGYVSAFESPSGASASIDNGGLWAWIDNYCAQHPLDTVATAAFHLVEALKLAK